MLAPEKFSRSPEISFLEIQSSIFFFFSKIPMHILPSKKCGRTNERAKTKNKLQGFGTTKICV